MYGRYGVDQLNNILLYATLSFSVIGLVFHHIIIYFLSYVCMFLLFARALSKNHAKRYKENQKFLELTKPVQVWIARKRRQSQDSYNKYYKCPSCHQTIRVPKGKGKIAITCPKCKKEFIKRT